MRRAGSLRCLACSRLPLQAELVGDRFRAEGLLRVGRLPLPGPGVFGDFVLDVLGVEVVRLELAEEVRDCRGLPAAGLVSQVAFPVG